MAKSEEELKELEALKIEADALEITYAPNIGATNLKKKIEEHKAKAVPAVEPEAGAEDTTPTDGEGSEEDASVSGDDGEDTTQDPESTIEPKEERPALKPLNATAEPKKEKKELVYTGGPKACRGCNATYEDTKENFPIYRTAKGDKNSYCKDFLDKKVKSGMVKVKKGVYVAVDPSKKK